MYERPWLLDRDYVAMSLLDLMFQDLFVWRWAHLKEKFIFHVLAAESDKRYDFSMTFANFLLRKHTDYATLA